MNQLLLIFSGLVLFMLLKYLYEWGCESFVAEQKELHVSKPKIIEISGFMSPSECDSIIDLCEGRFNRSGVTLEDGSSGHDAVRTSSSCFFGEAENELIKSIEARASEIANIPIDHIEGLQVVKYEPGQKYDAHNDWFHHKGIKNQRNKTILVYLNDNFEGGYTDFVNIPNLSVKPRKGNAILWDHCDKNGRDTCYEDAKHRGSPPTTGIKYAMNIWMGFNKYRDGGEKS